MFESIVNFVIDHAAAATGALILTGIVALAAETDRWVRDAKKTAPAWLRFLSVVLSKLARNTGRAANDSKAQLLALILIPTILLAGCASVHDGGVRAGGMAEAYALSGPSIEINAEGATICTTEDPEANPCRYQYAGGWEMWQPIVNTIMVPFEAVLQLFGRSLVPAGG